MQDLIKTKLVYCISIRIFVQDFARLLKFRPTMTQEEYSKKISDIVEEMIKKKGGINNLKEIMPMLKEYWTDKSPKTKNTVPSYTALQQYVTLWKNPQNKRNANNMRKMETIFETIQIIQAKFKEKNAAENPLTVPLSTQEPINSQEYHNSGYQKPAVAKKEKRVEWDTLVIENLEGVYESYYYKNNMLIKNFCYFDNKGNYIYKEIIDNNIRTNEGFIEDFVWTTRVFRVKGLHFKGITIGTGFIKIINSQYLEQDFTSVSQDLKITPTKFLHSKLNNTTFEEFNNLLPEKEKIGSEKCNEWIAKHPIIKEFLLSDILKEKHRFTMSDIDFSLLQIKPSLPQNVEYLKQFIGTYYIYHRSSNPTTLSLYLMRIKQNGEIEMKGLIDDYKGWADNFRSTLMAVNITHKKDSRTNVDYHLFYSQFIFFIGATTAPLKIDGIFVTVGRNAQPVNFRVVLVRGDFDFENLRGKHCRFFDTTFDDINKDAEIYRLTPLPPKKEPIKNVAYSLMGKTGNYIEASTDISFQPKAINHYAFMYFSSACYSAQNEGSEEAICEYLKEAFMHGFCRGKDEQKHKKLLKKEMETGALKDYADLIDFENLCMKS